MTAFWAFQLNPTSAPPPRLPVVGIQLPLESDPSQIISSFQMREVNNSVLDLGIGTCSYFACEEGWGNTTPKTFVVNTVYDCSKRVRR